MAEMNDGVTENVGEVGFKFNRSKPSDINKKAQEKEERQRLVDRTEEAIDRMKKQSDVIKEQYSIIIKHPQRLPEKREFEYENDPEWWNVVGRLHQLQYIEKMMQLELDIEQLQKRVNSLKELDLVEEKEENNGPIAITE
jgi:hypothetical protein